MEGICRVFDHVKGRCALGYKLLLCAFFDSKTTIPFDFSLHQEKGKQGNCGLTKQQRKKAYHTKKNNGSPDFNLVFLSHSEAYFSPFGLSESLRSPFFLHLAFLSHSEAHFFSIWPFWVTQKRIFFPFGLSESLRSVFLLHLVFLSHSEAWHYSFWLQIV